MKAPS